MFIANIAPVMKIQGLVKGVEHGVIALLALREIAAIHNTNLKYNPKQHAPHPIDCRQNVTKVPSLSRK